MWGGWVGLRGEGGGRGRFGLVGRGDVSWWGSDVRGLQRKGGYGGERWLTLWGGPSAVGEEGEEELVVHGPVRGQHANLRSQLAAAGGVARCESEDVPALQGAWKSGAGVCNDAAAAVGAYAEACRAPVLGNVEYEGSTWRGGIGVCGHC